MADKKPLISAADRAKMETRGVGTVRQNLHRTNPAPDQVVPGLGIQRWIVEQWLAEQDRKAARLQYWILGAAIVAALAAIAGVLAPYVFPPRTTASSSNTLGQRPLIGKTVKPGR